MTVTPYILATVTDDDAVDGAPAQDGGGWNSGRGPRVRRLPAIPTQRVSPHGQWTTSGSGKVPPTY
jgi:hypothetical protein